MSLKRVVVTGLGAYTPLGSTVSKSWAGLLTAKQSLIPLDDFYNREDFAKVKKLVPLDTAVSRLHADPLDTFPQYDQRRMTPAHQIVLEKTKEALLQANLITDENLNTLTEDIDKTKVGCVIGTGMPSMPDLESTISTLFTKPKVSPFLIPRVLPNMAMGNVMIKYGLQGPSSCPSTACATGNSSIIEGFNSIQLGLAEVMICGSYEFSIDPISIAGFYRSKTISKKHQTRPFDVERDGFIMGEGCGILTLESLESALKRGVPILAEISGVGLSNDGYHITSPLPDGSGGKLAMQNALKRANIAPQQVGYINAHATSTQLGDVAESTAISELFGSKSTGTAPYVSSNKGHIGHLLGASGSVESIFTVLSLKYGCFPHTLNLKTVDETSIINELNLIKNESMIDDSIEYALTNSFGFGGVNTSVLFRKYHQ
ncbi:Cem1 [Kluyveromyces lactis]|nr:Cem1 [Kluyveromyces lactis]